MELFESDWECLYQIGIVCIRLELFVSDWECLYQIKNVNLYMVENFFYQIKNISMKERCFLIENVCII